MDTKAFQPFSSANSPNFPEILHRLNCALAISTYQANKVVMIGAHDEASTYVLPRNFQKAMGIAYRDNKMAVATKSEIIVLRNDPRLAQSYPAKPQFYDGLFLPQATYYTGMIDTHDLHWGKSGLWAVNTSFSCLVSIDSDYSFTPRWKPHFITDLVSEDRCHLNGLAMNAAGEPAYVSALGSGNTRQSWRDNITEGGIIMDVASNEIVAQGLAMPHTPRLWNDELFILLSAAQKLVKIDTNTGKYDEVAHIPGFVRGMSRIGDLVFITTSKLRQNSSTFRHLDIAKEAQKAGIVVVDLNTGAIISQFEFMMSVDEIYDIHIIPGYRRPNILNTYKTTHVEALSTPDTTYWAASPPDDAQ